MEKINMSPFLLAPNFPHKRRGSGLVFLDTQCVTIPKIEMAIKLNAYPLALIN